MSTMTKTTVITWSADQTSTTPDESASYDDAIVNELQTLVQAGKTTGIATVTDSEDGSRTVCLNWDSQESAQAWLDFVLATLKGLHGPSKSFRSSVIEDIV
jgi:hypothetical protein